MLDLLEVRNLRIALNDPKKYEEKLKKWLERDKIFIIEELNIPFVLDPKNPYHVHVILRFKIPIYDTNSVESSKGKNNA